MFDLSVENTSQNILALRDAYRIAQQASDDPTSQIGAVLFSTENNKYHWRGEGTNQLKPGHYSNLQERLTDSTWKYKYMMHAEEVAFLHAKDLGLYSPGLTMAMPWLPCGGHAATGPMDKNCAQLLVDNGIEKLVTHLPFIQRTPERWKDSLQHAVAYMQHAGISLVTVTEEIGDVQSMFNGRVWRP